MIYVQTANSDNTDAATEDIRAVLRRRHRLTATSDDDFSIMSQKDSLNTTSQITNILTLFLGGVAGISLLVGGIGILGIALGWGLSQLIGQVISSITPVVGLDSVLLATVFSAAVGVFFGLYPAWRAGNLNPIDALRYE
jgi:putative ABC transport system permease protein